MQPLTLQQVLACVGLPRSTYYDMRARGEFPAPDFVLHSRAVGYSPELVDRWLRNNRGERSAAT